MDNDDFHENDYGGLSDDQWSDACSDDDNDTYFKTRHEHSANASNRGGTAEPSGDVPRDSASVDSWGSRKNPGGPPSASAPLPRNDDNKRMSAPSNVQTAVAEDRGRSVNERNGRDKAVNSTAPATQYNARPSNRNDGYGRDAQHGDQNSSVLRGESFESRPAVSRESGHHSIALPIFDNTLTHTYRYDQAAVPGLRRNEEPQARNPIEYRYNQHQHQQMSQTGYQAPPPNRDYGYGDESGHPSTSMPHNQPPYYPQGDVLSRDMSGLSISRGDQRSRVRMEPSSLVEEEYEGWNRADLNKELKRIEERSRAIMNVMRREGGTPQQTGCSDVPPAAQPSTNQDNNMHRDSRPPSGHFNHYQQSTSYIVPTSAVLPQPQQTQGFTENERTYNQTQPQQCTVPPSYGPTQTHNYSQVPQNSGNHQQHQQYQDRQPATMDYPPQQNYGPAVYATNSQQPQQHQQYTVPPSNSVPHAQNYPQNSGDYQQYQDTRPPVGVAYPSQQNNGPPLYATNPQQPQHQQYTVPPSNVAPQPQNYPQYYGGYLQNQDSRNQVSPPNYGSAEYQKSPYHPQQHQYSHQPVREAYPPQQNSGYGVHSYQQTQALQSTASTMATAPQHQSSNFVSLSHNYPYVPENLTNHQQQHYQDSRQPSRQVSPTQQYPEYASSSNYQQPQQHHVAVPPPHVAPQPYNYPYVPQNYSNQQQHQNYYDSRQPSRQASPTQHYPAYSANYQQPQQQPYAAVPYSHVAPQPQYSREAPANTSYSQQPPATAPLPQRMQEVPQNTSQKHLPQQHQASPESSAPVPSDPTRAEGAPPSGTDSAQPRYNKKGKLINEPSEEVRQWCMKKRLEEKAEKAARARENPEQVKLREDYERRKAAGEFNS